MIFQHIDEAKKALPPLLFPWPGSALCWGLAPAVSMPGNSAIPAVGSGMIWSFWPISAAILRPPMEPTDRRAFIGIFGMKGCLLVARAWPG